MFNFGLSRRLQIYFEDRGFEKFLEEYNNYLESEYDGKRGEMNFIDYFLEFTKEAESPTSFLRWSSISALSAVMRDNIYLQKGMDIKIYPNLFIILVASSGACRKGLPLKVTEGLISSIKNTKIIAGRTSIQAVIKILSENVTTPAPNANGDFMLKSASGILYSEELAALLVDDPATIPILTELYDFHESWSSHLKATATEKLDKVCLSMLAASNETFLKEVYQSAAIYGGLLARTIIVMESRRRHRNPRVRETAGLPKDPLIQHLRKLSAVKGKMIYDDAAADLYEDWYNNWEIEDSESRSGIEARVATTIEKVAMCLCVAESNFELIIRERHVKEAIDLCLGILKNYEFLTMSASSTRDSASNLNITVFRELLHAPGYELSKAKILRSHLGQLDVRALELMMNTLVQSNLVTIKMGGPEGEVYMLTPECIQQYQEKVGKKA